MVPRSVTRNLSANVRAFLVFLGALAAIGSAHAEDGQEALRHYDEVIQKLQTALVSQAGEETIQSLQEESEGALAAAERACKEDYRQSGDLEDALRYIKVLRLKGDDDLAAEVAQEAIDRGLESAALLREYGVCLIATGPEQFQQGVDSLYRALELDSTSVEALRTWNVLGHFYVNNLMPEAAARAFDAALAIDEEDVRAQLGRLVVDVFQGDVAAAGDRLAAVGAEAQPFDALLRAQLRLALNDFDTHRRFFRDTAENHYAYARLMYSAARFPEAMQALKRAVHLDPDDTAKWNFLANFQGQTGDYTGAVRSFEGSLRTNPDQPAIRQTLERLRESLAGQQPAEESATPLQGQGPLR